MSRKKIGRVLISVVLVSGAVISVLVDWNDSHLFNPEWVPHAKFHDVVMLLLLCGVSAIALWLVWRRSLEPEVGMTVATLVPVSFWTPFFINFLVPGTSPSAHPTEVPPTVAGIAIYPNIVLAGLYIVLSALAYWLYRTGDKRVRNR